MSNRFSRRRNISLKPPACKKPPKPPPPPPPPPPPDYCEVRPLYQETANPFFIPFETKSNHPDYANDYQLWVDSITPPNFFNGQAIYNNDTWGGNQFWSTEPPGLYTITMLFDYGAGITCRVNMQIRIL